MLTALWHSYNSRFHAYYRSSFKSTSTRIRTRMIHSLIPHFSPKKLRFLHQQKHLGTQCLCAKYFLQINLLDKIIAQIFYLLCRRVVDFFFKFFLNILFFKIKQGSSRTNSLACFRDCLLSWPPALVTTCSRSWHESLEVLPQMSPGWR